MSMPERMPPEPGPDADKAAIQADIEQTREQLAQTVDALSHKLDVKEQARHKVDETKERARQKVDTTKTRVVETSQVARQKAAEIPPPVIAVTVVALISLIVWRRRRR